jgi:hypothetical protein
MDFPHTQVDVHPTIMYAIVEHECSPLSYIMIGRSSNSVLWEIHKAPFLN